MSDRCYVHLRVRNADLVAAMEELGDGFVEEGDGTGPGLTCEEANYGACSELVALAARGVVFVGWAGTGASYDACRFVGWQSQYNERRVDCDGNFVVRATEQGEVVLADALDLQHFVQTVDEATAYLNRKP